MHVFRTNNQLGPIGERKLYNRMSWALLNTSMGWVVICGIKIAKIKKIFRRTLQLIFDGLGTNPRDLDGK